MDFFTVWDEGLLNQLFKSVDVGETGFLVLTVLAFALCIIVPYLLGSINLSIIISSRKYKDDIRNYGSGNAGMTNVMRTYGKKMGALTFAGDLLKAIVASIVGRMLLGYLGANIAGLLCVIGHIFPIFYKFKGGKGVVTACGLGIMTHPLAFLTVLGVFIVIVAVTKYVSLGSVLAIALYPLVLTKLMHIEGVPVIIALILAALCTYAHRANLKRLWTGTESKVSFKSKKKTDAEATVESDEA